MKKRVSVREGVSLFLDGNSSVVLMVPRPINELDLNDLRDYEQRGTAYCEVDVPNVLPAAKEKQTIDAGKIRALAAAGWNAPKIADEMGISAPTVRKYLKEGTGEDDGKD